MACVHAAAGARYAKATIETYHGAHTRRQKHGADADDAPRVYVIAPRYRRDESEAELQSPNMPSGALGSPIDVIRIDSPGRRFL